MTTSRIRGGALALLAVAAAACTSPESHRLRGGGPGADVGNHAPVVRMHEGARPYHDTPRRLGERLGAPIEPAQQADRLSRSGGELAAR